MTVRAIAPAALLLLAACETTVHIRLSSGDDMSARAQCDDAVLKMRSFHTELEREELVLKKCVALPGGVGQATSLAGLELLLGSRVVFDEVPRHGGWTVWVAGFSTTDCTTIKTSDTPLLCGKAESVAMPPPDDTLTITVSCSPDGFWLPDVLKSLCRPGL